MSTKIIRRLTMINISLTNTEFRSLPDLVYMGNWVINANRESDDYLTAYEKPQSKMFSYCRRNGFENVSVNMKV